MSQISVHQKYIKKWVKQHTGIDLVPEMPIEAVWVAIVDAIQRSEEKQKKSAAKLKSKSKSKTK